MLAAAALLTTACSLVRFTFLKPATKTPQPVIALVRCDEAADVLCLVTFGLEPPDRMVVVLLGSPGLPPDLEAVVVHERSSVAFPCEFTDVASSVIYCTGPQLPLGSTILIQIYTVAERILLASGEFVLTALALPTPPVGEGVALPTLPASMTARPTRTPIPGTVLPTTSPQSTRNATQTPVPGTAYPYPNP